MTAFYLSFALIWLRCSLRIYWYSNFFFFR